jgi:hypothetical protein
MLRSKLHRPWQPRMHEAAIFNPFAHTPEPEANLAEHRDYEELDELESALEPSASGEPRTEPVAAPQTPVGSGTAK